MKELKYTTQFKKDLKKIQNNPIRIADVKRVLTILQKTGTLPKEYLPHKLEGVYKGCMECHIGNDFLLIWLDKKSNVIKLIRIGSHSELF
jgi:mRNA interferase YafQ